jgi:hypothetical protein
VAGDLLAAADAGESLLLEEAQELDLGLAGEFADFVEEDDPSGCRFR